MNGSRHVQRRVYACIFSFGLYFLFVAENTILALPEFQRNGCFLDFLTDFCSYFFEDLDGSSREVTMTGDDLVDDEGDRRDKVETCC